jgi:hypothetical protein
MTADAESLCARVFDRMVERGDLGGDTLLLGHAGSCMTCFRALAELRDAPRLKEILRAAPPAQPRAGDPFWDALAARVIDAGLAPDLGPPAAGGSIALAAPPPRRRFRRAIGVALFAAAAAVVVMARRPPVPSTSASGPGALTLSAIASPLATDDASEGFDVGELDGVVLERLADRLRKKQYPTTYAAGDEADFEEEAQLNDELAELDAPALLRVQRSLARTAL